MEGNERTRIGGGVGGEFVTADEVKERNLVSVHEGREPLVFNTQWLRHPRLIVGKLLVLHNGWGKHEKEGGIRGQEDGGVGLGG
jgi:hypothetical protein